MAQLQVPCKKPCSLGIGSSVIIKGTPVMPFSMSPELQVDFLTGTEENSDIALYIRVYFGNHVVMNTRRNGDWGSEVTFPTTSFGDEKPFEMTIQALQNEYQININGRASYTFPHRFQPGSVKMVQVWRDVSLSSVTVI